MALDDTIAQNMTGLNHVTTGALIVTAVDNPWLAIPLAFVSHFVMDGIPHYGIEMDDDVFIRNRQKNLRIAASLETTFTIAALIILPILIQPHVKWWITLLAMLSALAPDLFTIAIGIREEITKRVKPRSWFMTFHVIKISHHHSKFILGMLFELAWFATALLFILVSIKKI